MAVRIYAFNYYEQSNSSTWVEIRIMDLNDNAPYFELPIEIFEVQENSDVGTVIGNVTAHDADSGIYGTIEYAISSEIVHIEDDGFIYLDSVLNREDRSSYIIPLTVTDGGGLSTTTSIILTVLDVNDNAPVFTTQIITGYTTEGAIGLSNELVIRVTDDDVGINGKIFISINKNTSMFNLIQLSNVEWKLNTIRGLELFPNMTCFGDTVTFDEFTLIANDGGTPSLSTEKPFSISVVDRNNHPPIISNVNSIIVPERSAVGTVLHEFNVSDDDPCSPNNLFTLSVIGYYAEFFRIQGTTLLVANDQIDFETFGPTIEVTIEATDRGTPRLSTNTSIQIAISDINDEQPQIHKCKISEWVEENIPLGEIIGHCEVTDKDLDVRLSYSLLCECKKGFSREYCAIFSTAETQLDQGSRNVSLVVTEDINFETISEIHCSLHVKDELADDNFPFQITSKSFSVNVIDVDDNMPIFESPMYQFQIPENMASGQVVGTVHATDLDLDDIIMYTMSSTSHFIIDNFSGEIKIKIPFDYERGFHNL